MLAVATALALGAVFATPASAVDFPEQANTGNACNALSTNPGQGPFRASPVAQAIQQQLFTDACLGGP